jgi:hypothetical protein
MAQTVRCWILNPELQLQPRLTCEIHTGTRAGSHPSLFSCHLLSPFWHKAIFTHYRSRRCAVALSGPLIIASSVSKYGSSLTVHLTRYKGRKLALCIQILVYNLRLGLPNRSLSWDFSIRKPHTYLITPHSSHVNLMIRNVCTRQRCVLCYTLCRF